MQKYEPEAPTLRCAMDEFLHFDRRDPLAQHAGGSHVHGQCHVLGALHQCDFAVGLAAAAERGHATGVFQRVACCQRTNAVIDEEGCAFADADARRPLRIRGDAHALQRFDEQAVRAFMFLPAVDAALDQHEVLQRAFFKGRGDVFQRTLRRQDGADHALAGVPFGAGEIGQVGTGVEVDRRDALLAHIVLRLVDAPLVFLLADGERACAPVGQGSQRLLDGFTADAQCCLQMVGRRQRRCRGRQSAVGRLLTVRATCYQHALQEDSLLRQGSTSTRLRNGKHSRA